MNDAINLAEKLTQFSEHWAPRTVAQLNDYDIMRDTQHGLCRDRRPAPDALVAWKSR